MINLLNIKPILVLLHQFLKLAYIQHSKAIYWYSDNQFLGLTRHFYKMEFQPSAGKHLLVLIDQDGNLLNQPFEVVEEKNPIFTEIIGKNTLLLASFYQNLFHF